MLCSRRIFAALAAAILATGTATAFDYNGTPAGWLWGTSDTSATIKTRNSTGFRPTSIDAVLNTSSATTFRTAYVQNTGSHSRTTRFESAQSQSQIQSIRSQGWRIVDVEQTSATTHAAVFLSIGAHPTATDWFVNKTASEVTALLGSTWRLLELDSYLVNGQRRFSGVMIHNGGSAFRPWGWMPDATLTQITNWANANNMRVIDLDPRSSSRFSAVFVRRQPGDRTYYVAGRLADVQSFQEATGTRFQILNKLESQDLYAAILVNNVNAQNARVADTLAQFAGGFRFGAYVRQVNGPVLVDLRSNRDYYPASSIKVLIHAAGLAKVNATQLDQYRIGTQLLSSLASDMMKNSDNPDTYTLNAHFGTSYINGYGRSNLGTTTSTWIATHYGNPPPNGELNANARLVDMANIYVNYPGQLGSARSARFKSWMLNETNSSLFSDYAASLRTTAGLTTVQYNDWFSRVTYLYKGGNIGLNGSATLNRYICNSGTVTLPFKSGSLISLRRYVFGWYVDDSLSGYPGSRFKTDSAMLLREQILASMSTFK